MGEQPATNPLLTPAVLAQAAQMVQSGASQAAANGTPQAPMPLPSPSGTKQLPPIGAAPPMPQMTGAPSSPGMVSLSRPKVPDFASAKTDDAGPVPTLASPSEAMGAGKPPSLPSPTMPEAEPSRLLTDQKELGRKIDTGDGISQIHGKIEGLLPNHPLLGKILGVGAEGLARLGDVGLRAVAPSVDEALPGTSMHHQADLNQGARQVGFDEANAEKEAQTHNLDLQPAFKQQGAALAQEKQHNVEQHQSDVLNQTKQHQTDTYKANLAQHGFAEDEEHPGQLRPLRYEEMSEQQQAVHDLKGAQEEQADATAALRKAQNDPSSPAYRIAAQRVAVAQQNARTAQGRLGLSSQEFGFNQDKYYNPQPTAKERTTGDLAQSAVNQVHTMREIIKAHPEMFGPGGEAHQAFQRWLSSNGEDAGRFLAASTYLADHSAGVFGGRGQYITQHLQGMTNSNYDPSTLNGVLDQAEDTAGHFVKAGTVHSKGGSSGFSGGNTPQTPTRPAGVPANATWNAQGNNGKGSWRVP